MEKEFQRDQVIFDGDCGVCRRLVQLAIARDQHNRLNFSPYQTADLDRISAGLTREMASRSLYFIRVDGHTFHGARAVFETMKRFPGIWKIPGSILSIPFISFILEPFYLLFARYRGQISNLLRLQQCALEHRGTEPRTEEDAFEEDA